LIVRATGEVSAVIPVLEKTQWHSAMPNVQTHYWADADGCEDAFSSAFSQLKGRIAVEGLRMRVREVNAVRKANPQIAIIDEQELISSSRLCKQDSEIAILEKAIGISETALHQILPTITIGMSEVDLKRNLLVAMLENGADGPAFDPIVLFGPAAADCHGHSSSTRTLASGDAVLVDFGAAFGGYNADITRTFFAKKCSGYSRDFYETVLAANTKGRAFAKAGVTASQLDAAVTQVLQDSTFRDFIVHKTGHGLGIDVHEWPQIMIGNDQQLAQGMVLTIEPGLYDSTALGVRIEDDVLINQTGSRSLSRFTRDLTIVG
jgi:Xaa-Pro dipeptidase